MNLRIGGGSSRSHPSPQLRAEDYLFGKRIVDQRGKLSSAFRGANARRRDLIRGPERGTDELVGPGKYTIPSAFADRHSFLRVPSFGKPPKAQRYVDPTMKVDPPGECLTNVSSTLRLSAGPRWTKPARPEPRDFFISSKLKLQTVTEFTSTIPTSIEKFVSKTPRGAVTDRSTTSVGSKRLLSSARCGVHYLPAGTEFTTTVPSSFKIKSENPCRKRDVWRTSRSKVGWRESSPGPGEYFIP